VKNRKKLPLPTHLRAYTYDLLYGRYNTAKQGGIADFVRAGSPADLVGAVSMTEITPYFVKNVSKLGQFLYC
jgi:hypothetical protein